MSKCATSSLGAAVPVSFMALFDDSVMYTYTVPGVHEGGVEHIPGNPYSRLFLTKAVRVLSFAPVEAPGGGGGSREEGGLGPAGGGPAVGVDEEPDGYLSRFFRHFVGSTAARGAQESDDSDDASSADNAEEELEHQE